MTNPKKDLQKRLKTLSGQILGIARMVEEESDCVEIVTQIRAVRGGLDRVLALILQNSLEKCLALKGGQKTEVEKLLNELSKK